MLLPTVGGDRLSGLKEFKLKRCLDHLGFVMNLDKASGRARWTTETGAKQQIPLPVQQRSQMQ